MAQVRQENDEYQSSTIACYAEYGFSGVREMGGNVVFVDVPQDPATQALMKKAFDDCDVRVPRPAYVGDQVLDDAAYGKMVQLRDCVMEHGYPLPEPPTAETWKESNLADAWNPYQFFIGPSPEHAVQQSELFGLEAACPQPGPNFVVVGPSDQPR
ncbi:MAG: hypothetical protein FWD63_02150 [Propionibacteriaceae bacterium]|nr:hypothetical protein [Propionibacteriaceae bacterium]